MLNFTDFYIKNWGKVYKYCKKYLKNSALAEEAAQETFGRLLANLDDVDERQIMPWLLRVAHNICVDIIRKESRNISTADIIIPEEETIGEALMNEAKEIAKTLKPIYREIFDLIFVKGYKNQEAAKILGLPVSTVTSRLQVCIKLLRHGLQ